MERQMDNSHNKNNYYSRMKDVYSNITNTELWQYLDSDEKGHNYAIDISRVCFDACTISETITELLPNFTKHDTTHIASVLDWMFKLIDGKKELLKTEEVALLIMIACCHDVGMSISESNKKVLLKELETERLGQDLKEYFKTNKRIENEYLNRDKETDNWELYNRIIRDFVRQNHHLRVEEVLGKESFNGLQGPLRKELVISLCKSHGEDLSEIKERVDDTGVRIYLLAILLRLADILNFDTSRSPDILFRHAGLDKPKSNEEKISANEHLKNQICQWTPSGDSVVCTGECPDNQLMHDVLHYAEWVRKEVESSNKLLNEINSFDNPLIVKQVKTNLSGDFLSGDYKLTVSTKRVIELLGSEDLYVDSRAFLTELIQNSIDAILVRTNIDHGFSIENGKIDIYIWEDNDYIWTRIDDNGFGMDENIIKKYFLSVGESFYNSYEYKKIRREGNNDFTPINRFGIGILSCFMNQSDVHLEVETKNINNENVYRMDITSLDGFYSLYKVDRSSEVVPMSAPPFVSDLADGYNRDFGTSICVKHKKIGDYYSVERYKNYIDECITLPILDFNIYTRKEPVKLTKQTTFIDALEIIMNGRKYKNFNDHLEIYYFNSLESYFPTYTSKKKLDASKLKDVKLIIFKVHDKLQEQIRDIFERKLETFHDFDRKKTEYLEKWFIENKENFDPNESIILTHIMNAFKTKTKSNIHYIYNGITIDSFQSFDWGFVYCIVKGSWFERVNLSKTELLGMQTEKRYLADAVEPVLTDMHFHYDMPCEWFEALEQKVIDSDQGYSKKGYIDFVTGTYKIKRSRLAYLSYLYNLHISFDKKDMKTSRIHFCRADHISQEESKFRYGMFENPICIFENDSTTFIFRDIINYNYPLTKWVLRNFETFSHEHVNLIDTVFDLYEFSGAHNYSYKFIYEFLVSLKNSGYAFFDDEILEYMESIKEKTGGPFILNEFDNE